MCQPMAAVYKWSSDLSFPEEAGWLDEACTLCRPPCVLCGFFVGRMQGRLAETRLQPEWIQSEDP
jgi:hypothetical protein